MKIELERSHDLLEAVHAAGGTWRKWTLVPPKQLLVLRSLIARGRAREKKVSILHGAALALVSLQSHCSNAHVLRTANTPAA